MPRSFDTLSVDPSDSFDFWVEAAVRSFYPLSLRRRDDGGALFRGAVRQWFLGPTTVTHVLSQPTTLTRTWSDIAMHDPETLTLTFQLRGHSIYAQDDRTLTMTPGCMAINDISRPFSIISADPIETVVLEAPRSVLGIDADKAAAHALDLGRSAFVKTLMLPFVGGLITGLRDGSVTEHDPRVGESALELVRALLADSVPPTPRYESSAALLARIRAYIEEHLPERSLRPDSIAAAHYISTRHLQRLFKDEGVTVTDWIRDRRLAGARRDLCDPALANDTILSISSNWGMANAAHFSRLFRATYGVAPREFRAGGASAQA